MPDVHDTLKYVIEKGCGNAGDFYVLQDTPDYLEEQFKLANLDECSFYNQTENGYRCKKWYAIFGNSITLIPMAIWLNNGLHCSGMSIRQFLGSQFDAVSFFLCHRIEMADGVFIKDELTHYHVTFNLSDYSSILGDETNGVVD